MIEKVSIKEQVVVGVVGTLIMTLVALLIYSLSFHAMDLGGYAVAMTVIAGGVFASWMDALLAIQRQYRFAEYALAEAKKDAGKTEG